MKEKKIKYEEATLNFRVTKMLKKEIVNKAIENNITVSKYLRGLLESVHDGSYGKSVENLNAKKKFLFSKEFLKLMVWIFSKKDNTEIVELKQELKGYIKTLKRIEDNVPSAVAEELDKVLFDLLRVIKEDELKYESYNFVRSYKDSVKVNFDVLKSFLLTKELDLFLENHKKIVILV